MLRVIVVGAGAWGSALGKTGARAGAKTTVFSMFPDEIRSLDQGRSTRQGLNFSSDKEMLKESDVLVLAFPAPVYEQVLPLIASHIASKAIVVIASKGIETSTGKLLSQLVKKHLPRQAVAVLSGPNFAKGVEEGQLSAAVVAHEKPHDFEIIAKALGHPNFLLYPSPDLIGVQVAGALKNVVAIGCGLARGLDLGKNAEALLLTKGFQEIQDMGVHMGGSSLTFSSVAGIGDLILSCSHHELRNFRFGALLAVYGSVQKTIQEMKTTTEGVDTARVIPLLTKTYDSPMPLCQIIHDILYNQKPITAIRSCF